MVGIDLFNNKVIQLIIVKNNLNCVAFAKHFTTLAKEAVTFVTSLRKRAGLQQQCSINPRFLF